MLEWCQGRRTKGRSREARDLHAVEIDSSLWHGHLAFRDRLRDDSDLREEYTALERRLALEHARDRAAYTAGKAPFVEAVLAATRAAPASG